MPLVVVNQGMPLVVPIVTLFGSVHEKLLGNGSMRSMLFPNFGSMFSMVDPHAKQEQWDEESLQREGGDYTSDSGGDDSDDYTSDASGDDSDDNLQRPLISRQTTSMDKDMAALRSHGSVLGVRRNSSLLKGTTGEESMGIGGS